jgi:hypothetical protein
MSSSKDCTPLQAVDVRMLIVQREDEPELEPLRERINERAEPFCISRGISELIRFAGIKKLAERQFTDEELLRGQEIQDRMEADFQKNLQDFSRKRVVDPRAGGHVTLPAG